MQGTGEQQPEWLSAAGGVLRGVCIQICLGALSPAGAERCHWQEWRSELYMDEGEQNKYRNLEAFWRVLAGQRGAEPGAGRKME